MKPPAKKPSLGEVAVDVSDVDDTDDEAGEYDAAVDEVADLLGVSEDKLEAFRDAFKAAVMSCK